MPHVICVVGAYAGSGYGVHPLYRHGATSEKTRLSSLARIQAPANDTLAEEAAQPSEGAGPDGTAAAAGEESAHAAPAVAGGASAASGDSSDMGDNTVAAAKSSLLAQPEEPGRDEDLDRILGAGDEDDF